MWNVIEHDNLFIWPDLADVVRGFAHLEGAGRGVGAIRHEVGVVGGGGAPAPPSQGAAHTKPAGAGPGGRAAWWREGKIKM